METTDSIKRRIGNVEDLLSIVETMKMMAAINIRHYEQTVEAINEYGRTVDQGFQVLFMRPPGEPSPLKTQTEGRTGAIIFGSDQGMCGQFNEQIASFARQALADLDVRPSDRMVLALGTRLAAHYESINWPVDDAWLVPSSVKGITPLVQDIVLKIDKWRATEGVSQVLLFYNRPLSSAGYESHLFRLLPLDWDAFRRLANEEWPSRSLPQFTSDWAELLAVLLRQYLFVSIYRAFAESLMSENASRLMTMQAAERNIEEHLEELNTQFHQQRQQSITAELLDIIAGFESVTSTG
jgi:F-type H+-transporting ATPase subunit gamma